MLNSKKRQNSLSEEKVFVTYKDNLPARVIDVEKRGRKIYLLLRWENFGGDQFKPERWVKDTLCVEYKPTGKKTLYQQIYGEKFKMSWWQSLIVKLQNWWYGIRN